MGTRGYRVLLGQGEGPIDPKKGGRERKDEEISGPSEHIGPINSRE